MQLEELEEMLNRQPGWQPPPGFARQVVARVVREDLQWPAAQWQRGVSLVRGLQLGALAAVAAYVAGRLVSLASLELVAHPIPVAWACALVSLSLAGSLTFRVLRS
jgi:hypothetical protein